MVRRKITIGDREFEVGPLGLGTVRRVPEAFQIAGNYKHVAGKMPTSEEFEAMVALVFDGVNADQFNAKKAATIEKDDFDALVNSLDIADGLKQLSLAIGAMTAGRVKTPRGSRASGKLGKFGEREIAGLFGLIVTATGWTFEQVNQVTLDEVDDLVRYWKDTPPVHVSVVNLLHSLGGTSKKAGPKTPTPTGTPDDWASMETTAPKPTQAELRGIVQQLQG
jgi:hypothetical protein